MAVILQMTYQKKLGLPNYSSHSCAVSLTVEIPDVGVAAQESTKLYALLQTAVDNEIKEVGFMPDAMAKRRELWLFDQPVHHAFIEIVRNIACVAGIAFILLLVIALTLIGFGLFTVATKFVWACETKPVHQTTMVKSGTCLSPITEAFLVQHGEMRTKET